MVAQPVSDFLANGVTLTRWFVNTPGECGTPDFWQVHPDQLFNQMLFKDLFGRLKLNIWHMDHPELHARVQRKQWCLTDYDTTQTGYQVADGLTAGAEINLGLFPAGWQPTDTDYSRPISEEARLHARKALSHEFGHFYQNQSRYWDSDDIAKWIKQRFNELRPHQCGDNEAEDWAETYRAILGADECRGYFSDNKPYSSVTTKPDGSPFHPSELYSLMKCAYWLQGNLAERKLYSINPQAYGVQYCILINNTWVYRFISLNWQGQEWVPPANGKPEYWKPI